MKRYKMSIFADIFHLMEKEHADHCTSYSAISYWGNHSPQSYPPLGYVGITEGSTEVCISNLTEKCVNLEIKQGSGIFSGSYSGSYSGFY